MLEKPILPAFLEVMKAQVINIRERLANQNSDGQKPTDAAINELVLREQKGLILTGELLSMHEPELPIVLPQ